MKNLTILPILLLALNLSAQEPLTIHNGCNFEGDEKETEYYSFDPSNEASKIVRQILDAAGSLSYNSFILKESNVENAVATVYNGDRFILYSTVFLEKFKGDAKTKWAAYTVLAHEIGHHLNNHNFAEQDPKKRKSMELEADKFAGAVCRTLGATLEEALAGIESMKLEGETATHPAKSARRAAVANGWKKQDELLGGNVTGLSQDTMARTKVPPVTKAVLAADACLKCEGQGTIVKKVKCQICGGDGKKWITEKCPKCDGTGRLSAINCSHCNGLGKSEVIKCSNCDGTGIDKHAGFSSKCFDCDGTGKKGGEQCFFCKGTGKDGCNACATMGTIRTGKETCSTCNGIGRIDERQRCDACKGTGKKKKP